MTTETASPSGRVSVQDLRIRYSALRVENKALQEAIWPSGIVPEFLGLSPSEAACLRCLLSRREITRENLQISMYPQLAHDDLPDPKGVDVRVFRLRQKLADHGVLIEARHGVGYFARLPSRARAYRLFDVDAARTGNPRKAYATIDLSFVPTWGPPASRGTGRA